MPRAGTPSPPAAPADSLRLRQRTRVVLVRARNPNNIGAVARAMHDFGFPHLHLVNEYPVPLEAARSAVDASAVVASAIASPDLASAVAGCTLVAGTTAVGERDLQHPLLTLPEAAERMQAEIARPDGEGRVALLFGSEKTGLSNDELSHCDVLLTIPMQLYDGLRHPSMNLGQAVAVCLWELVRSDTRFAVLEHRGAAADEIERVYSVLSEVLEESGYTRRHAATADSAHIRRLVHRMRLGPSDVPAWFGILRQVLWKLRGGVR